jgi:SAM-dependent methyltransferase
MNQQPADWVSFWNAPHSTYVNARHLDMHYRDVAAEIVALLPASQARVLDYGCGEALHADRVAAEAAALTLCESAASVRASLARRFAGNDKITIAAPEDIERQPDATYDFIVANSLVQYLSGAELDRLLALWRRLLAPGGRLVVGDVIPPNVGAASDVIALLRYAARRGFLMAALWGLARTAVSPYRKIRSRLGVSCYPEGAFLTRLGAAGYEARRAAHNLEHNPARMTFIATPGRVSV